MQWLLEGLRAREPRGRTPRLDRRELAAVAAGGALGALLRVWLGTAFSGGAPGWPWVTFTINVTGAFALGYLAARLREHPPPSSYRRAFLATGFCGAYTTFSTMAVEVVKILDADRYALAAGYVLASVTAGYLAIWLASALARRGPLRA